MPYYNNRQVILKLNKDELEEFLEKRNLDAITFRDNFIFNSVDTENYVFIEHIWSHGDRLFKLGRTYLSNFRNYWLIGLFNKKPTDADYKYGDVVYIPVNPLNYYREVVE